MSYDLPKEPVIPNIKEITGQNGLASWMSKHGMKAPMTVPWGSSKAAADKFTNFSLDGVYLTTEHDYRVMLETMELWWSKVRRVGIMAGHDFHHNGYKFSPASVDPRNAIQRWCDEKHVTAHVCEDGTWLVLKRW